MANPAEDNSFSFKKNNTPSDKTLKEAFTKVGVQDTLLDSPHKTTKDIVDLLKKEELSFRKQLVLEELAPQLIKNEEQKRVLKIALMIIISVILFVELTALMIPILLVFINMLFDFPFCKVIDKDLLTEAFKFLSYFISIVVAELVAMLFFIVRYVFDKSIHDLLRDYKNPTS